MIDCPECGKTFKDGRGLRLHKCTVDEHQTEKETNMTETNEPTKPQSVLTSEERSIADRVASQDTDWFTIREDELEDFSLQISPFDLKHTMPEAWKMQTEKQFAFRYCTRDPRRIDELTRSVSPPLRWAIVTRTTLPELEKYVDPVLGCIATLDQVLLFKPWSHHEIVKRAKQNMAEDKARSGGMDAIAETRASDKIRTFQGDKAKIGGTDEVQYTDNRSSGGDSDLGDLVVE